MDQHTFDKGSRIRAEVLGTDYVTGATRDADEFNKPMQDLVTEYCWGAVWGGMSCRARREACSTWP